ncbi:hypothetical protein NL676_014520 [Syzygium grande]|nr:hypothetical protein NL676_014520 [Syzygium grande]
MWGVWERREREARATAARPELVVSELLDEFRASHHHHHLARKEDDLPRLGSAPNQNAPATAPIADADARSS